jgi:hypothetical protein
MSEAPEITFARFGKDRIAYQVLGEGPPDLLYFTSPGGAIEAIWEYPPCAASYRRLASSAG